MLKKRGEKIPCATVCVFLRGWASPERGRPKIGVAGGALVSFNLSHSKFGRPQARRKFLKKKIRAEAGFETDLKAGIGVDSKGKVLAFSMPAAGAIAGRRRGAHNIFLLRASGRFVIFTHKQRRSFNVLCQRPAP